MTKKFLLISLFCFLVTVCVGCAKDNKDSELVTDEHYNDYVQMIILDHKPQSEKYSELATHALESTLENDESCPWKKLFENKGEENIYSHEIPLMNVDGEVYAFLFLISYNGSILVVDQGNGNGYASPVYDKAPEVLYTNLELVNDEAHEYRPYPLYYFGGDNYDLYEKTSGGFVSISDGSMLTYAEAKSLYETMMADVTNN